MFVAILFKIRPVVWAESVYFGQHCIYRFFIQFLLFLLRLSCVPNHIGHLMPLFDSNFMKLFQVFLFIKKVTREGFF